LIWQNFLNTFSGAIDLLNKSLHTFTNTILSGTKMMPRLSKMI
jgi:hypothetical protein